MAYFWLAWCWAFTIFGFFLPDIDPNIFIAASFVIMAIIHNK